MLGKLCLRKVNETLKIEINYHLKCTQNENLGESIQFQRKLCEAFHRAKGHGRGRKVRPSRW